MGDSNPEREQVGDSSELTQQDKPVVKPTTWKEFIVGVVGVVVVLALVFARQFWLVSLIVDSVIAVAFVLLALLIYFWLVKPRLPGNPSTESFQGHHQNRFAGLESTCK